MGKIFSAFKSLSIGLKILIIFTTVVTVSGIGVATHILMGNEEKVVLAATQAQEEKNKIPEDVIADVPEEIIKVAEEIIEDQEEKEEEKEEKKVKYKDKEIVIPKAKVAAVNEKEDAQTQKSGGEKTTAAEAIDKFENDGQYVGIDVSKHQGKINWAEVKKSGIEFAIIRVGFRGQTAGSIYEDAYFKTNVNGAVSNGIKVGIYFYSCAINEDEALQEAAWVVNMIKSYRITYPVVYDFEDFGRYRCAGVSGEQATSNAIAFLNYVRNAGYTPMMYANKNDITNRFNKSRLSGYKFWLAHYTSQTNYTGKYDMWQYTSSGSVPGISGRVDMNVAYFGYGSVAEPKHTHDFENGTVIKTADSKAPTCETAGVRYIRCKECSESKKEVLEALGHKWGNWITDKKPTEEETGEKHRVCGTCKKEEKVEIPKIPKAENNTTNTNTNTNSDSNNNNDNNTDSNTNTTVNTHSYEKKVTPSTCKEAGKEWEECSCGDKINENTLPLAEHDWEWSIETEPTVDSEGLKKRVCSVCSEEEKETIPKKEPEGASDEDKKTDGNVVSTVDTSSTTL